MKPAAGMSERASGVLLHITSLPGAYGCGDLGPAARHFVDFLAQSKQRFWQTLPINPVGLGDSPYCGLSVFAGNPLLISLDDLVQDGLLLPSELETVAAGSNVDFAAARRVRHAALRKAFLRHREHPRKLHSPLEELRSKAGFWLPDYALFCAARAHYGERPWHDWEPALASHDEAALAEARRTWASEIQFYEFEQVLFDQQWKRLRSYAAERGVALIGDAPIFVAHDSADVWGNQAIFRLDERGLPTHVAGVPPDYFSATGQRWGMPLYRWKVLARDGYRFWVERLSTLLQHFDRVRLDHFIGFARYWEIAAEEETAVHGRWMKGPGAALFETLKRELPRRLPECFHAESELSQVLIAEDLGCVNDKVHALRERFALPSMRVLQFGFGGADEHLPHNYPPSCVAYTGTHDTDTLVGWLAEEPGQGSVRSAQQIEQERGAAIAYALGPVSHDAAKDMPRAMIRVLFASPAQTVIVPIQDWLGLGSEARMNLPGKAEGNWTFRVRAEQLSRKLAHELRAYAETYRRCPPATARAFSHHEQ